MHELIGMIAQQLVDYPEDVNVSAIEGCYTTVVELRVAKADVGKVIERGWQAVTGNQAADFKMTRRHEQWGWFSLIGAVANSEHKPSADGTPQMHQIFKIGNRYDLELERPGYLYAYANDAWDFYGNNSGSLQLRVQRLT